MEKAGSSMNKHAGKCAKEAGLDFDLISSCVNDPVKSMALQRKYAERPHAERPQVYADPGLEPSTRR